MHLAHTHHNFTDTPSSLIAAAKAAMYPGIRHNRQHVTLARIIVALGCKSISGGETAQIGNNDMWETRRTKLVF